MITTLSAKDLHLCRCDHERHAHLHYRPGTDCFECECPRFTRAGLIARALAAIRRQA